MLDVTDTAAIHDVVDRTFEQLGRIDVVVSNAGYGLSGAAEELTDAQVEHIIATNLTGSIQLIRSALRHLRRQGGGRIIQISSYGGQVAFPGNAMYHATKWGIEGPLGTRYPDRLYRAATSGKPSCASDPWLRAAVPWACTEMSPSRPLHRAPRGGAVAVARSSEAVRLGRRGGGLRTSRLGLCRRWR